jgi:hypothetical protein
VAVEILENDLIHKTESGAQWIVAVSQDTKSFLRVQFPEGEKVVVNVMVLMPDIRMRKSGVV